MMMFYSFSSQLQQPVEEAALAGPHLADQAHKTHWQVVLRDDVQGLLVYLDFSILPDPDELDRLAQVVPALGVGLVDLAEVGLGVLELLLELGPAVT